MTEPHAEGNWLRQASPAEWVKAVGIIIALVIAGVQLRQEVTALRSDVQEIRDELRKEVHANREVTREVQRDLSEVQRDQAGVKVLVEQISSDQKEERARERESRRRNE